MSLLQRPDNPGLSEISSESYNLNVNETWRDLKTGKSPESVCHDLQLITPSPGAVDSDLRTPASRSAPSHPRSPITLRLRFFKNFTERGCQGFGVLLVGDWSKEHGIRADHSLALFCSYQPQTCSDHLFGAQSHPGRC